MTQFSTISKLTLIETNIDHGRPLTMRKTYPIESALRGLDMTIVKQLKLKSLTASFCEKK